MRWRGQADLLAAMASAVAAAVAALLLPPGPLRLAITLPALAIAPGYLVLQAAVPRHRTSGRLRHACAALGVGPAILGLCALATSLVPGGFQPLPIIATTTATALLLGIVAWARRPSSPPAVPALPAATSEAAAAGTAEPTTA